MTLTQRPALTQLDAGAVPGSARYLAVAAGVLMLALGIGFGLNMPGVTALWPWPDGRLSYLFIGSILGAISVALIWIGLSGEWGALPAGALTSLVMTAGMAIYLFQLSGQPGRQNLFLYAVGIAAVCLLSLALFLWSRRFAVRDRRLLPLPVRLSFIAFIVTLLLAAAALLLRVPSIFPWPLNPDSSVMFGCIFLGDAVYFLNSLLNRRWHNARGQLLSFLAYDLFLIVPFLGLFNTVRPEHTLSLMVYVAVLVYSSALAVYYLFINERTRTWTAEETS